MIMIKKYMNSAAGEPPKLISTMSLPELIEQVGQEIQTYKSRLPKQKTKTWQKIQGKISLAEAYKVNLENVNTIEDLSHVMSTSVRGRYRIEDPNGNILKIVYEADGVIFWDFEDTEVKNERADKSIKSEEQSAWDRLKAQLDEIQMDQGFDDL